MMQCEFSNLSHEGDIMLSRNHFFGRELMRIRNKGIEIGKKILIKNLYQSFFV